MPIPLVKMELEVCGWPSLGIALDFLNAIQVMPGVQSAIRTNYRSGTLSATIAFKPGELEDVATVLETAPSMKRFRLSVKAANKAKVEAWVAIR